MLHILWQWNGALHKIDCITFTEHLYVYAMTGAMPDFSLGAACTRHNERRVSPSLH